jgi:hypothetical protein
MVPLSVEKSDSPKTHQRLSHPQFGHNSCDQAFLLLLSRTQVKPAPDTSKIQGQANPRRHVPHSLASLGVQHPPNQHLKRKFGGFLA